MFGEKESDSAIKRTCLIFTFIVGVSRAIQDAFRFPIAFKLEDARKFSV